jgi:hypothetical protein
VAPQRSPSKSTRKAAAQLGISRWSARRILKTDLNLYPYKVVLLPKLRVQKQHQRMIFVEWAQNYEVSFNNVWLSYEAHFHLESLDNKQTNKQNVWFWASQNPCVIHEKVHHSLIITVWATN